MLNELSAEILSLHRRKKSMDCEEDLCKRIQMAHIIIKVQLMLFVSASILLIFPAIFQYYMLDIKEKIIPITIPLMDPSTYRAVLTEQIVSTLIIGIGCVGMYTIESLCVICCFNVCQYIDWHFHEISDLGKIIAKNPNHFNKKKISKEVKKIIRSSQKMYTYV